jgi:A/G-specific adenine glycosylase
MIDDRDRQDFQTKVWEYYHQHARKDLPWRQPEPNGSFDPYHILVSELMLQQTQVSRVIPKYKEFLARFPASSVLAAAPLAEVLKAWNGLGYNRRAKYLRQSAQSIERSGKFPATQTELEELPGVGPNTAGAILAYAHNEPAVFIETNIRTVYIHHFFNDETAISDKSVRELVMQTLDTEHPREWYWALMDYGSYLKQSVGNLNRQSQSYAKQSKFQGSRRQIRGQVLRLLGEKTRTSVELAAVIKDERLLAVIDELVAEGMIRRTNERLSL